jgi:hypothetical protein
MNMHRIGLHITIACSAELQFSVDELGRLLALDGLAMIVSNGILVPILARFLPERLLIVVALLAQSLQVANNQTKLLSLLFVELRSLCTVLGA